MGDLCNIGLKTRTSRYLKIIIYLRIHAKFKVGRFTIKLFIMKE